MLICTWGYKEAVVFKPNWLLLLPRLLRLQLLLQLLQLLLLLLLRLLRDFSYRANYSRIDTSRSRTYLFISTRDVEVRVSGLRPQRVQSAVCSQNQVRSTKLYSRAGLLLCTTVARSGSWCSSYAASAVR